MAPYAALVCFEHIIDNLQLHPRPPISLQKNQVDLLTQKITFLQQFLEGYNPNLSYNTEADPLESRITDAAYAAEGVIQSHIADQITHDGEKIISDDVCQALEKVIEEMALIEEEALKIKQTHVGVQHDLHTKSTPPDSSGSSSSTVQKSMMVGADDVLLDMKYELTSNRRDLQIIPIVGMGGTGKTTLAMNIYHDPLIREHFDCYAWTTISQEYSLRDILTQLLRQLLGDNALGEILQKLDELSSENKLGETLYKFLFGKKYIIVMDDLWSVNAWDEVKKSLPDNGNGSRIIVTTRLSNLGATLAGSKSLGMGLLNEIDSWELLSKTVFGEQSCPVELEEIGKKIGKSCKGLPLSIVVVGGLLSKSKQTREVWKEIEDNLNSIVNLEDDERCLKILHVSYKQLPVYLKPCFLYMGDFPDDVVIPISRLAKLWVAEGFLKPVSGKVLEDIAKEYLKELVDRNLVLIHKLGCTGNIKQCKIHDLLRDLSLREAQKERFYTIFTGEAHSQGRTLFYNTVDGEAISHMSLPHSSSSLKSEELDYRFTRIVEVSIGNGDEESLENMRQLVNSRFLALTIRMCCLFLPFWQFWNLQTLIVSKYCAYKGYSPPDDIWCMPSIRHVHFDNLLLPNFPNGEDVVVLTNLQSLGNVWEFKCSEQVVKRIPNIRKLCIYYGK